MISGGGRLGRERRSLFLLRRTKVLFLSRRREIGRMRMMMRWRKGEGVDNEVDQIALPGHR